MTERKQIKSLSGIRAFYALLIVSAHFFDVVMYENEITSIIVKHLKNTCSVFGFFMLSGFLIAMHYSSFYEEMFFTPKKFLKEACRFTLNHVKKWYLLYIIALLPLIILMYSTILKLLAVNVVIFGINLFMLQSILPFPFSTFYNGVEWYLSCMMFLYFMVPFILHFNKKIKNNLVANIIIAITFIAMTVILNDKVVIYTNPIFRIFQFGLGIIAYNIAQILNKKKVRFNTLVSILVILLEFVAALILHPFNPEIVNLVVHCLFLIVCFNSDYESPVLTNKIILKIASMSLELYLIHFVFVFYCARIYLLQNPSGLLVSLFIILVISCSLGASILLHYVLPKYRGYQKLNERIMSVFDFLINKLDDKAA